MVNEYEQLIAKAIANCELLDENQSREECCKEKKITDCPPLQIFPQQQSYSNPSLVVGSSLLVILILGCIVVCKRRLQREPKKFPRSVRAILAAWAIWIFITLSYVFLLNPYGYSIEGDEFMNLALWFVLPPLATLAIFSWIKKYLVSKQ